MNANRKGKGEITATCQNAVATAQLSNQPRIDLTFNNRNPKVTDLTAFIAGGKSILRTKPGANITLVASTEDSEQTVLQYKWIPYGNFPGFVSSNTATVNWQLPNLPGRYEMDLMVLDNYGGVAYKSYNIVAGDEAVSFSGIISDINDNARIPGAKITVNGKYSTIADSKGYFSFQVPQQDSGRYILNAEKAGYCLRSVIYFKDAVSKEYKLVKATTQTFDPKTEN